MATQPLERELDNREFFIRRWEQEYPAFVKIFRALPSDRLDYRPHPRSRSAGELIALLVSSQQSCIERCKSRESIYSGLRWREPAEFGSGDKMISTFEQDHATLATQLRTLESNWDHPAWLIEGKEGIVLKYTIGGLLWIALFDSVHHRGQLSAYIRLMGGKVPSIYGPSADESAA
jgi:uncharacterized damage-inducible protein DinB